MLAAGSIGRWFDEPKVAPVLRCLAWSVPLIALCLVPRALLLRRFAFRALALRSTLGIAAGGLAGVSFAAAGAGFWSLVVFQLVQPAMEAAVLWGAAGGALGWRPSLRFSPRALGELAGFVGWVFGERVCHLIDSLLPRVVLGQGLGPVALGHYTLARRTLEVGIQFVVIPLNRVALPSLAEARLDAQAAANDVPPLARLQRMAVLSARASTGIALPIFLGLAIVADDLVLLLFGPHWAVAASAVSLAALLGPALSLMSVLGQLLLALGRSREVLQQAVAGTALLALLLALLPVPGVTGVLLALLLRTYALLPLRLAHAARATQLSARRLARALVPSLLAALGMAAVLMALRATALEPSTPIARLAVSVAAGALVYAALLAAAEPGSSGTP